jgi:hypothetical protein
MLIFFQENSSNIFYEINYDEGKTILDIIIKQRIVNVTKDANLEEASENINVQDNVSIIDNILSTISFNLTESFEKRSVNDIYTRYVNSGIAFTGIYKSLESSWSKEDAMYKQILYSTIGLPSITIYQNETIDDMVIHVNGNVSSTLEKYPISNTEPRVKLIKERSPWVQDLQKKLIHRNEFVYQLSTANSVAYLEVQIDYITKAIQFLLSRNPEALNDLKKELPNWDLFMEKSLLSNVMTVKNIDSCVGELDQKTKIRQLQSEYIDTRNDELTSNIITYKGITIK